jgi:hypothetical protein
MGTKPDRTARARTELQSAVVELNAHYEMFLQKHQRFTRIQDGVQKAILAAEIGGDIKRSAEVFEDKLSLSLRVMEAKQEETARGWTSRLKSFLPQLYVMTKLGLRLTSTVSSVSTYVFIVLTSRRLILFHLRVPLTL